MTKTKKYLEALKTFDDWTIVSEWAVRVGELYPDLLEAANAQAANHKVRGLTPFDYFKEKGSGH